MGKPIASVFFSVKNPETDEYESTSLGALWPDKMSKDGMRKEMSLNIQDKEGKRHYATGITYANGVTIPLENRYLKVRFWEDEDESPF